MKGGIIIKRITISSLLVCLAVLGTVSTAQANTVNEGTTEGSIHFRPSSDILGNVVKPETTPSQNILPASGSQTSGDLRIQHVPDFDFGTQELQVGVQEFSPFFEKYVFSEGGAEAYSMPHFIQITDNRGTNQGWQLSVHGTTFKKAGSGDALPFAKISLDQGRLSNDVYDSQEIADRVSHFRNTASELIIPTTPEEAKLVMKTKGNDRMTTTNGSQTSLVLAADYDNTKLDYALEEKNQDIRLIKSNRDVATVTDPTDPYIATITWTLSDGI